jgi:hypothetical protein
MSRIGRDFLHSGSLGLRSSRPVTIHIDRNDSGRRDHRDSCQSSAPRSFSRHLRLRNSSFIIRLDLAFAFSCRSSHERLSPSLSSKLELLLLDAFSRRRGLSKNAVRRLHPPVSRSLQHTSRSQRRKTPKGPPEPQRGFESKPGVVSRAQGNYPGYKKLTRNIHLCASARRTRCGISLLAHYARPKPTIQSGI